MKKIVIGLLICAFICNATGIRELSKSGGLLNRMTVNAEEIENNALEYSYEVTPVLSPFNEYFFVKTDNPDPQSFRFLDRDSVYEEDATINACTTQFADVVYEDDATLRVNGGYIFEGYGTDGGSVDFQIKSEENVWGYAQWVDTDVHFTLPVLWDDADYLIHTYATESDFFSNMDAVQNGFSQICLYSGSSIRGDIVYDPDIYWSVGVLAHVDQSLYLYSPYDRADNKRLFASAIYPFRYDSLGFPGMMAEISQRLDRSSSYQWSDSYHWLIEVTKDGETRTYGGAGEGEGQGISEDKISRYFTFDEQDQPITLEGSRELLEEYSRVEMPDDTPQNMYTWKDVCETVGDGAWIAVTDPWSINGEHTHRGYTYLYKKDDKDVYNSSDSLILSRYISGSLGYCTDAWIDGRYIDRYEIFVPGASFEEHPHSDIIVPNVLMPEFDYDYYYQYDYKTEKYEKVYSNITITEQNQTAIYSYDEDENVWNADAEVVDMIKKGLVDEAYLDVLQLTYDEVMEMDVDRNTNLNPDHGYIYDGSARPGTWFDMREAASANFTDHFTDAQQLAEEKGLKFQLEEGCYGMCGSSMYWVFLKDSGTLLITGAGEMACAGGMPWSEYENTIIQILIGEGVSSIQKKAFEDCTAMERVEIPDSVTEIGAEAFWGCASLKQIRLPKNLMAISKGMFGYCNKLEMVEIPASVTEIRKDAFYDKALDHVVYGGDEKTWKLLMAESGMELMPSATVHYNAARDVFTKEEVVPPDCVNFGYTTYKCSLCEKEYTSEFVLQVGHSFENGVCRNCGKNKEDCIESDHPYENNTDKTWTIYRPGAAEIVITFSSATQLAGDEDKILIYNKEDNLIGNYFGNELASRQIHVTGDTVTIKLLSDEIGSAYGFAVSDIEVKMPGTSETDRPEPSETEIPGASGDAPSDPGETPVPAVTTPPEFLYGDLDGSGNADANDALVILKIAAKLQTPTEEQRIAGDVDESGSVDANDALYVLQKAAKLIDVFPIEAK